VERKDFFENRRKKKMAIKIEIQNKEFTLSGGEFYDMLSSVKAIQGRRWDDDRKLWLLPVTLDEAREILSEYEILDEDEALDFEAAEIQKLQKQITENQAEVLAEVHRLDTKVKSYSFRSKSSVKSSLAIDAANLRYAINSAKIPIADLADIQIAGMKSACKLMGWV
jgi:hypothetical protein